MAIIEIIEKNNPSGTILYIKYPIIEEQNITIRTGKTTFLKYRLSCNPVDLFSNINRIKNIKQFANIATMYTDDAEKLKAKNSQDIAKIKI